MNRLYLFILFFCAFFVSSAVAQTVSGKIVDHNGSALREVTITLYSEAHSYTAVTQSDGSFNLNVITDVEDEELPVGYAVSENYPNPFNPVTRINFLLPQPVKIGVEVFNILGEKVTGDLEKFCNAGSDHIDIKMDGLPNGIYFARISIGDNYTVVRKLMLLYGSQHLNSSPQASSNGSRPLSKKHNPLRTIDSIVVSSKIIGRKKFSNFPELNGEALNIGNLTVERYCAGVPVIIYNSKSYNTVQVGTRCWLKENLDIGTVVPGSQNQADNNIIEKYYYGNDAGNGSLYGGLYQWKEAVAYGSGSGGRGICPEGWHVPTKSEFEFLWETVSQNGNALKAIGAGTGTDVSGFSAKLGGYGGTAGFSGIAGYASFWTSSQESSSGGYAVMIGNNDNYFSIENRMKEFAFSVRCIKDEKGLPVVPDLISPANSSSLENIAPQLEWNAVQNAESYTLQLSEYSTFSGSPENYKGLKSTLLKLGGLKTGTKYYWHVRADNSYGNSEWSDTWEFTTSNQYNIPPSVPGSPYPAIDAKTSLQSIQLGWESTNPEDETLEFDLYFGMLKDPPLLASGLTEKSYQITYLQPMTKYYWKIVARDGFGNISTGMVWSFNTNGVPGGITCPDLPEIIYEGRTYHTVQIGPQCWLKENLNVGSMIGVTKDSKDNGIIEKFCYNDDEENCEKYGAFYQWAEAVQYLNGTTSLTAPDPPFSGNVRGICPEGWHIPSRAEFALLIETIGSNGNYLKAVGQGTGAGVGTNTSGFSALLGGDRFFNYIFEYMGESAVFWSSTDYIHNHACHMNIDATTNTATLNCFLKIYGYNVRCIKD